jgi:hypothetical protein
MFVIHNYVFVNYKFSCMFRFKIVIIGLRVKIAKVKLTTSNLKFNVQ